MLDAGTGESIVARTARMVRSLGLEVVLVGSGEGYQSIDARRIADVMKEAGPLAGVAALLVYARGRVGGLGGLGGDDVISIACDLPHLRASIVARLSALPQSTTCAPYFDDRFQPSVARWSAALREEALRRLREGPRALHALLEAAPASRLTLDDDEIKALVDWDTPEDRLHGKR
ncbi:MAG: hypothetical protein NVSMB1_22850 [Polyangiales bacterium]